ncbi:MAG: peptidase [Candidatus Peregrinibacteria bacterium Greene1014_49]|nr:MAG: peptidase [Candidatus Peregrinibacteria bacterium Greene1014_49]
MIKHTLLRNIRALRRVHAEILVACAIGIACGMVISRSGPMEGSVIRTSRTFPAFDHTVFPVSRVPNWGAMHSAAEWNRPYDQMTGEDFVATPGYDLEKFSTPFKLVVSRQNTEEITRRLFYSTKFLGQYDIDAGEYTGTHPGVDLKLAFGTPVGSIAGGRVYAVRSNDILGTHVIIEHRHPRDGTFYSTYAHLSSVTVRKNQRLRPGQTIGAVGMTGNTSAPHLHLQVDREYRGVTHAPYQPTDGASLQEMQQWTVNPIRFIERYAGA